MSATATTTNTNATEAATIDNGGVMSKVREVFAKLDANGDGHLTRDELHDGLKLLKLPATEADVDALLARLDVDKDGNVSLLEFEAFAMAQSKLLRKVFDDLDADKSGTIDVEEVRGSLQRLGMKYDDGAVTKLIKRIDVDGNGKIDFNEWQTFLLLVPSATVDAIFHYWEDAMMAFDSEDGVILPPAHKPKTLLDSVAFLSSGAIAAMTSRTATAPLERIRTIYQVQSTKPSIGSISRQIYAESGVSGFWRGNGANLLKVAPEKAIKFWTYETIKATFGKKDSDISPHERFIAGAGAGVFTHTLSFPLEVIKTRLAAAPNGTYTGITDVVRKIVTKEGPMAFFRGLTPSLLSTAPHSGIDLTVYEVLKREYTKRNEGKSPGVITLLGCASASSVAGLLACYPLHVAKTRMIMQSMHGAPQIYSGVWNVFTQTYSKEGFVGLYRGLVPSILKSVPSHCITFVTYEFLKKQFGVEKHSKH